MPSAPPPCWITSTFLPSTTVVPFTLEENGSTCAMWFAQIGAPKLTTTIARNSASAASATRLRARRTPARSQGFFPATSRAVSPGASATPAGSGSKANSAMRSPRRPLLHRHLGQEQVPLRAELEALHAARHEVELLGVEHRDPRGLVGDV